MSHFAVIGTREIKGKHKTWISGKLTKERSSLGGEVLHTGACQGVDQFAAEQWLYIDGKVHLHLPNMNYEHDWVESVEGRYPGQVKVTFADFIAGTDSEEAKLLAEQHHPRWNSFGRYVKDLHTRNVMIVAETERIYACPSTKPWGGGTAMGIKIALHMKKQVTIGDEVHGRTWTECGCNG